MLTDKQEIEVLRLHGLGLSPPQIANAIGARPGPVASTLRRGCTREQYERRTPSETCKGLYGEYLPSPFEIGYTKAEIRVEGFVDQDGQLHKPWGMLEDDWGDDCRPGRLAWMLRRRLGVAVRAGQMTPEEADEILLAEIIELRGDGLRGVGEPPHKH